MKWEGNRQSDNVEDRRGEGPGMGGGGFRVGGGRGIGIGTIVIALVAGWALGINPLTLLGVLNGGEGPEQAPAVQGQAQRPPADDRMAAFVSTVLADTEDVWRAQFAAQGSSYREPKLVLFRGATRTACGAGQAAMGPFYCPGDQKVYIDLGFYSELRRRYGAPGDFAQAYVLAHEVGHHVQNLLGTNAEVQRLSRENPDQANELSVRLELQADCFAGVWGRSAQAAGILEAGDIEEGLNAAAAIGDDRIDELTQGRIRPEDYTHGTSEQRAEWLRTGIQVGNPDACDTFSNDI
jgi:uncharacterized protein